MNKAEWNKLSSRILKAELKRRGITYESLAGLLCQNGITETKQGLLNKLHRGAFSFSFFLQCAAAIGIKNLHLDDIFKEEQEL